MHLKRILAVVAIMLSAAVLAQGAEVSASAPKLKPGRKWVFAMTNFASDSSIDSLINLMQRAKKVGYNGMVVSDVKFDKFQLAAPATLANLKRFRQVSRDEGMDFVAGVAPFGYADAMLSNDPNLAEGMAVRDAAFVVKGGQLVPFDETTKLINGDFEDWKDNTPTGWTPDEPGKISFRDDQVKHGGAASLRQEDVAAGDKAGRGRMIQKIAVLPWHYYHVSVWIKTENCTSKDWRIFAYDGTKPLNWQQPLPKPTQDWTEYHATFNSLDNTELGLYIGCWNGKKGKVWFDDVRIEPAGFVNVLRRDSLPLKITSADGKTVYAEGKDFAAVVDPKLGHDPNPGYFTNWHDQPVVAVPAGSRLKEGDKVLASYHFTCTCGKPNNVNICMSEPKTYEIIEKQMRWMKENAQADAYMLSHDEIRMQGWDDSCAKTGKTSGQILADCVRRCVEIVKRVEPGKPVMVWNDMFDPNHNAREKDENGQPFIMYMTRGGTWAGSWDGLSSDVGVATWLYNSEPSLKFFADRGEQQILAGYYDYDPSKIVPWLETASKFQGISGVMYTTWVGDYSKIEAFIDHVKAFEAKAGK